MTVRFKNELVRNITIKLGYANAKVSSSPFIRNRRFIFFFFGKIIRYTNAKTQHVPDQAATAPSAQIKKTPPFATVPPATTA